MSKAQFNKPKESFITKAVRALVGFSNRVDDRRYGIMNHVTSKLTAPFESKAARYAVLAAALPVLGLTFVLSSYGCLFFEMGRAVLSPLTKNKNKAQKNEITQPLLPATPYAVDGNTI